MTPLESLACRGWVAFESDPVLSRWVAAARPVAEETAADPQARADWLRCGGTWFAGVNIFPNDASGAVPGRTPPLAGRALETALASIGVSEIALDPAQISVCYPGYPRPSEDESEANFRFRRDRDAAHVDGLQRDRNRNRSFGEAHGFILGIPLSRTPQEASPLVVWEGSHEVVRTAFRRRLAGIPAHAWAAEDLTETYVTVRREIFATCKRVAVPVRPGQASLVHRLALHGVAPWGKKGGATPRVVAYFRPDPFPGAAPDWWLDLP